MANRQEIEDALAAWRDAERRRDEAVDSTRDELEAEVVQTRGAYQKVAADHMAEQLDRLKATEDERARAQPSTPPYHEAAKEEAEIAAEIWSDARDIDAGRAPGRRKPGPEGEEGPEALQN